VSGSFPGVSHWHGTLQCELVFSLLRRLIIYIRHLLPSRINKTLMLFVGQQAGHPTCKQLPKVNFSGACNSREIELLHKKSKVTEQTSFL